ncbi:MAG: class I SAM-dependent methyltransferase [Candidatus Hydrogenedentes bacterium]|nr:class I SAM-dependent methyltransferase [Candidatus Hydrogenedentota bacterium]
MGALYDTPVYYELAFSYRDIEEEVDVMEEVIRRHSRRPVGRVLEVCCGHAPHMPAWLRRGYEYAGIDLSPSMVAYAESRAGQTGGKAEVLRADMTSFSLPRAVDFAYLPLSSLYVKNSDEMDSHFNAMAEALRPGGVYLLEWCVNFDPFVDIVDTWEIDRESVHIDASYYMRWVDRVEQCVEETIHLCVAHDGKEFELEQKAQRRLVFPQEFLAFIRAHHAFEFVGWWNDWNLNLPVEGSEPAHRPITVIRRV